MHRILQYVVVVMVALLGWFSNKAYDDLRTDTSTIKADVKELAKDYADTKTQVKLHDYEIRNLENRLTQ